MGNVASVPLVFAAAMRCSFTAAVNGWICSNWHSGYDLWAKMLVNEFALRLSLPKYDMTMFPDGRAIVKGTTDVALSRSLYLAKMISS